MKRIAFAVSVAVLVFGVAMLAKTQTEGVEQELMALENGWNNAMVKGDFAFLDRILADDYLITDWDANVLTKPQFIAQFKSGQVVFSSQVADNVKVRVYGDAAVVIGRNTFKGTTKGKDVSGQERWTDIWIKRDGRWQCVGSHSMQIPQK
jgi:ketosteroid isomerase-like protein